MNIFAVQCALYRIAETWSRGSEAQAIFQLSQDPQEISDLVNEIHPGGTPTEAAYAIVMALFSGAHGERPL